MKSTITKNIVWYAVAVAFGIASAAAIVRMLSSSKAHKVSSPNALAEAPVPIATMGSSVVSNVRSSSDPHALPGALQNTVAPRLQVSADGSLAKTRSARDFFDYFLSVRNALSAKE